MVDKLYRARKRVKEAKHLEYTILGCTNRFLQVLTLLEVSILSLQVEIWTKFIPPLGSETNIIFTPVSVRITGIHLHGNSQVQQIDL
jgi:hypothetical protein